MLENSTLIKQKIPSPKEIGNILDRKKTTKCIERQRKVTSQTHTIPRKKRKANITSEAVLQNERRFFENI